MLVFALGLCAGVGEASAEQLPQQASQPARSDMRVKGADLSAKAPRFRPLQPRSELQGNTKDNRLGSQNQGAKFGKRRKAYPAHARGNRRTRVSYVRLSLAGVELGLESQDPDESPHIPLDHSSLQESMETDEMGANVPAAWISEWAALELELRKRSSRLSEITWAPSVDFVSSGLVVGVSGVF